MKSVMKQGCRESFFEMTDFQENAVVAPKVFAIPEQYTVLIKNQLFPPDFGDILNTFFVAIIRQLVIHIDRL